MHGSGSHRSDHWLREGKRWVEWDTNDDTRTEVESLVAAEHEEALASMFSSRLQFGTAGLRGPMGAGSMSMNELTVIQTAQGLVAYLAAELGWEELRARGVAVGHDHRRRGTLSSERFAALTCAVLAERSVPAHAYSGTVPTPMVPWAVERIGAAAGVMVTASHNPKADNGYKVYWGSGAQITPPHDAGIAAAIEANLEPWTDYRNAPALPALGMAQEAWLSNVDMGALADEYFVALRERLCRHHTANATAPPMVYTAMHGVGGPWAARAFETFGFAPALQVAEQAQPDPEFPTVAFPNPEEPAGLALARAMAEAEGAALVLANDPDADRLAVAERQPGGGWRALTGNEIGALLAAWEWQHWRREHPDADSGTVWMLASTVSSSFVGALAAAEGFRFEETLTGFKWMGRRAAEIREEGGTVLLCFEEAIGFCVGDVLKDKDGLAAAAVFREMAAALGRNDTVAPVPVGAEGEGVLGRELARLGERYGHFVSCNGSVLCPDPSVAQSVLGALRCHSLADAPTHVGGAAVVGVRDLLTGFDSAAVGGTATLPREDMVTYTLGEGRAVATLRASGTEPKLKYYCEVGGRPGTPREAVAAEAASLEAAVRRDLLRAEEFGLA